LPRTRSKPKPGPQILEDPEVMAVASISNALPKATTKTQRKPTTHVKPKEKGTTAAQKRAEIVAYWRWTIANEAKWHYAQERPMERLHDKKGLQQLPRTADCSEHFTDGYAFAGALDPNGANFAGTGFTGTLIANGYQVPKSEAQPGDAVIFGSNPGHHVCGVLVPGDDPLLVSHGQERGPFAIRFSQEAAFQSGPARFFRYLPRA
jgi:cell wall-associated NlpC family hydrolase